jgi:multidrug efflux system membrane fusion protein
VVFFDNQVDPATGTVRVRARLENPERRFAPGMFARVKLGRGTPYEAVLVRDSAIGTDQDRRFVLVVNPQNQVEYRTVELGALHEGLRVVRRGLAAGDRVIVNGLQRARPGSVVEPEVVAMDRPRQVEGSEAMVAGLPRRDVQ